SVTTFDPGAKEVFTHGRASNPFSLAFLATRPAPNITWGFDVLVQDVMAAITTAPSESLYFLFPTVIKTVFSPSVSFAITAVSGKLSFDAPKGWLPPSPTHLLI